jgi:hypothetical protein
MIRNLWFPLYLLLGAATAHGACPGEPVGGIGGTGLTPPATGGIGGTGLEDDGTPAGGIGGTGFTGKGDGIGGTGILGEIVAFGSICVNGYTVTYDASTPVEMDGIPATANDLAIGQIVIVEARGEGLRLVATRIRVESQSVGPAVRLNDQTLAVQGRTVAVLPTTTIVLPGARTDGGGLAIPPDIRLRVHGFTRPDGSVAATRIEPVEATVPAFDRRDRPAWFGEAVRRFTVEGILAEPPGRNRIRIENQTLAIDRATRRALRESGLAPGDRIRVSGERTRDGTLRVERLEPVRSRETETTTTATDATSAGNGRSTVRQESGSADRRSDENAELREERTERSEDVLEDAVERMEREAEDLREDRLDRLERDALEDRIERVEREERVERVERVERDDRVERPDRDDRPERPDRDDRPDRLDLDLDDLFERD